jgi:DNA-binding LacI/PurR family transcriptional regulator
MPYLHKWKFIRIRYLKIPPEMYTSLYTSFSQKPHVATLFFDFNIICGKKPTFLQNIGKNFLISVIFCKKISYNNTNAALLPGEHHSMTLQQQNGNMRTGRRLPQREIAVAAGVSISTVSRVLNRSDTISSDIKERVLKAAISLGYPLANTDVENITLFMPPLATNPVVDQFEVGIIEGMEAECRQHGIRLSQMHIEPGPNTTKFVLERIKQNNNDGFIFLSQDDTALFEEVCALTTRVALINVDNDDLALDMFLPNNSSGAHLATRHLLQKGHTKILCVASFLRPTLKRRYNSYRTTLEEAGIAYDPNLVLMLDKSLHMEVAYERMQTFLADPHPDFTAVFCINDGAAMGVMGVMRALQVAGLHVPRDISVVGFDDINFAAFMNPPLTTIRIERNELGKLAVQRLLERAETPTLVPIRVETHCRLIERQSVAAISE